MYQWPEQIPREEYTRLYFLEKTVRRLIMDELSKLTRKWWKQRIPEEIREKAEERKKKEEELAPYPGLNLHPIWYVDFSHYKDIIAKGDNWEDALKQIFKNKDHIRVWLEGLIPIRNKIAHMRPLTPREKINLEAFSQDILVCIWEQTCNRPYINPAMEKMRKGECQEAGRTLQEGFEKTGEDAWIAYNLGRLYKEWGKVEKEKELEKLKEAEKWLQYAVRNLVLPSYKKQAMNTLKQVKEKVRLTSIKICPKCSNEVPIKYLFCGECGYEFTSKPTQQSRRSQRKTQPTKSHLRTNNRNRRTGSQQ